MLGSDTHIWDADSEPFELSLGEKFSVNQVTHACSALSPLHLRTYFNQGIEERWKCFKQDGNDSFQAGEHDKAIKSFSDALSLTTAPLEQIRTFKSIAMDGGAEGTLSKVVKLVWPAIDSFISKPLMWNVPDQCGAPQPKPVWKTVPNQPAAICLANRAAVYLQRGQSGDYEKALKDGKEAIGRCPEYLKGHTRVMRAKQKLGDKSSAKKKNVEIQQYTQLCEMMPWNGPALYMIGWITGHTFEYLYQLVRYQFTMAKLLELGIREVKFHLSVVGLQGGQWAVVNLMSTRRRAVHGVPQGAYSTEFKQYKVNGLRFYPLDARNAQRLDEPPHGSASDACLEMLLGADTALLAVWVQALKDKGIRVPEIVLGQGLVMHADTLRGAIANGGEFAEIVVSCVTRTATSDRSELPTVPLPPGALQ
jgi:tetratricopeptide (TPR) repeat protein